MDMQCGRNNVMNEYVLDMGRNPNWYGTVTQFLFCPGNVQGKYHVDSFEVLEPSSSLALESMWKSFMAFEVPQMWSVNFMFGPRIGGTSVNLYIYILILLVSVIWGAGMLAKTGDPKAALKMMPKIIVITSISLWVLLDLRILLDQGRNMLMDSQTFSCKSLEEKRALVTLGDYYDFISFAATKIPQGSSFNVIRPQGYYYMEKAVYYLYPDYVNEKPEYMMVFDPYKSMGKDIGEAMKNGYKAFATYKEGAFILKK
jgi:hypothetical protein